MTDTLEADYNELTRFLACALTKDLDGAVAVRESGTFMNRCDPQVTLKAIRFVELAAGVAFERLNGPMDEGAYDAAIGDLWRRTNNLIGELAI